MKFNKKKLKKSTKNTIFFFVKIFLIVVVSIIILTIYSKNTTMKIVDMGIGKIVYYDTETKVMYLMSNKTVTPLYNADGTLKLYEGGNENE